MTNGNMEKQIKEALREAYFYDTDKYKYYVRNFRQALLPLVYPEDFEFDLRQGSGSELEPKENEPANFNAVHSSSALVVNCFAPFRRNIHYLTLPVGNGSEMLGNFDALEFEKKCPTGLQGTPPHLDIVVESQSRVVGIESKFTEYLTGELAEFKDSYKKFENLDIGYSRMMKRLKKDPKYYKHLNAAQLIKHAFGLIHSFSHRPDKEPDNRPVILLYLYWEPKDCDGDTLFATHRAEVEDFAERVAGSPPVPTFKAMSYPELWKIWRQIHSTPSWLREHIEHLRARYEVSILSMK